MHKLLAQSLLTFANVVVTGAPMLADFNRTHATNPLWTGHARYHVVWQAISYVLLGVLNLYLIWGEATVSSLALSDAILSCILISFFITGLNVKRFGGAFYDSNGYLPWGRLRIFGKQVQIDGNATVATIFSVVLIGASAAILHAH